MINTIIKTITLAIMFSAFVVPSIGQVFWADSVLDYSSRYSPEESSELQILGKPNAMPQGGDLATAWKPDLENDGFQHIRVSFEKPVDAYQVFIAENYNPGSIASIEMFDSDFRLIHKVSEIPEPFEKPTRMYNNYFGGIVKGVKYLRLLLSTEVVEGYNAIDAIGLSEDKMPYLTQIEEYGGSLFKDDPINLGSNVNTVNSDRFPVISPDEKTLYFCRTGDTNNYGSYYNTDIYISKVDENGNFGKAYNAGKPLNNGYSNFVTSAMPDGNTIVLGTAYQSDSISYQGISLSRKIGENWSPPSNIVIDKIGRTGDYNEYYLTADGLHLLMGISRIDSYGKNDLYISRRINDTLFSEPVNLGPDINTAEYEAYPFLASDGRTLYFCSSGFPGYGERDIYISRRIGEGWDKWSEPRNLGPKINTNKFEGNISIPASGEYAYFVSSIYGYGQEDIFKIKLPQAYKPEPIMLVSGIVRDQETNTPIGAEIVYEDIYTGEMLGKAYSNQKTGAYSISLPSGNRYSFSARSQGYYGIQENINLKQISNFDTTYKDLSLAPIKKDYAIRLNNIFFDSGEHELLPGSMTELSQLARYLSDKDFRIRIEGHTDNIGTIRDNQVLSEKRAKAVYNFLISVGIPARYLTTKGFGESQPLSDADTDEARKLNRRVEFRVLKGLDN